MKMSLPNSEQKWGDIDVDPEIEIEMGVTSELRVDSSGEVHSDDLNEDPIDAQIAVQAEACKLMLQMVAAALLARMTQRL